MFFNKPSFTGYNCSSSSSTASCNNRAPALAPFPVSLPPSTPVTPFPPPGFASTLGFFSAAGPSSAALASNCAPAMPVMTWHLSGSMSTRAPSDGTVRVQVLPATCAGAGAQILQTLCLRDDFLDQEMCAVERFYGRSQSNDTVRLEPRDRGTLPTGEQHALASRRRGRPAARAPPRGSARSRCRTAAAARRTQRVSWFQTVECYSIREPRLYGPKGKGSLGVWNLSRAEITSRASACVAASSLAT